MQILERWCLVLQHLDALHRRRRDIETAVLQLDQRTSCTVLQYQLRAAMGVRGSITQSAGRWDGTTQCSRVHHRCGALPKQLQQNHLAGVHNGVTANDTHPEGADTEARYLFGGLP